MGIAKPGPVGQQCILDCIDFHWFTSIFIRTEDVLTENVLTEDVPSEDILTEFVLTEYVLNDILTDWHTDRLMDWCTDVHTEDVLTGDVMDWRCTDWCSWLDKADFHVFTYILTNWSLTNGQIDKGDYRDICDFIELFGTWLHWFSCVFMQFHVILLIWVEFY